MKEYFEISQDDMLPVLEQVYCENSLDLMKQHLINYQNTEKNLVTSDFDNLNKLGAVINMYPEHLGRNSYWVPEELLRKNTKFIRDILTFKKQYQTYANKVLNQISESIQSGKEPLYIGVHIRRTDYIQFSKTRLKKV